MKVNVTCTGCEVTVEEIDGQCIVSAFKDGELIEEFIIDCEETEEEIDELEDEIDELEDEIEELEDEEVSESIKSFGNFFKS